MRTRLIIGGLLTLVAAGVFYGDHVIGPPYPFVALLALLLVFRGSFEFCRLCPRGSAPPYALVAVGTLAAIAGHWSARHYCLGPAAAAHLSLVAFAFVVLASFILELNRFSPGQSLNRIGLAVLGVAYLGLLSGFFADIRLFQVDAQAGTLGMILAVFVPKGCDIGAYFTGRAIGKHKMTPVISPNKTWEGAVGGLVTATVVALVVQSIRPIIAGGWLGAIGCGFTVGLAGMLGDLAESLMKRDSGMKDSANLVPGFGGLLDIVDAIIFSAPVTYCWLAVSNPG